MFTEATLDFPDEDIEFMQRADAVGMLASLRERLDSIAARSRQGSLLREGLDVVLIGQPNVGKSSLMNQLACDDVAIVTPHAGTTRDAIRSSVEIRGIPLHIIDTAGLRESADPIERIGIERTWATIARADLALIVTDARESDQDADVAIVGRLPQSLRLIVVRNKIDLAGIEAKSSVSSGAAEVWLSAKTGAGVELLREAMLAAAGAHEDMEGTFLARERHLQAMRAAGMHLDAAGQHLRTSPPPLELFAEELRGAQQSLSAITGEVSADDLLGVIFSRFCIGK
jgi:tRNA modification GTPase